MHEMGLMDRILSDALATGASSIRKLRVRVGALSGVEPDALRFAFEALSPGTPAEGAALEIDPAPVRMACDRCGAAYEASLFRYACPSCGSSAGDIVGGTEVELLSIEVPEHV